MGALYIICGVAAAGIVIDLITAALGDDKVENYDYHFATGVGAVFSPVK